MEGRSLDILRDKFVAYGGTEPWIWRDGAVVYRSTEPLSSEGRSCEIRLDRAMVY